VAPSLFTRGRPCWLKDGNHNNF